MSLQPWKLNQELKKRMGALGIKNPHHDTPKEVNPFRPYRPYPIPKLIQRLGLSEYAHQEAPLTDYPGQVREVRLMLKQHLGAPCQPTVAVGDEVIAGQQVAATPEGALGAHIHASLSGQVKSIDDQSIVIS
jgi:hypothetical protein